MKIKLNDNFLKIPIAHRGCHNNEIAENSLNAFKIAKNRKIAIELDIYKLKDDNFAVFHDENMQRMTGNDILISSLTKSDLQNYKLFDNQKIPLLSDVLNLINGEVPLLIELKPEGGFNQKNIQLLLDILDKYNHNDKIAIQSFNPLTVRAVKKLTDKYPVGLLSSFNLKNIKGLKKYLLKSLFLFNYSKADFVAYDIKYIANKYVSKLKKKNIPILSWVVDNNEKLEIAKKYADNIIFENLEILENYEK